MCGGGLDGVGVGSFDAMGRGEGVWVAPDAIDAITQDAGTRTMIIAASGSDMADSFVSNWSTPSKLPESLISSDVTGNNLAVSSPR